MLSHKLTYLRPYTHIQLTFYLQYIRKTLDTVSLNKKYVFVYCSTVRTYKVYILYIKSVVYKNNDIIIA